MYKSLQKFTGVKKKYKLAVFLSVIGVYRSIMLVTRPKVLYISNLIGLEVYKSLSKFVRGYRT